MSEIYSPKNNELVFTEPVEAGDRVKGFINAKNEGNADKQGASNPAFTLTPENGEEAVGETKTYVLASHITGKSGYTGFTGTLEECKAEATKLGIASGVLVEAPVADTTTEEAPVQ